MLCGIKWNLATWDGVEYTSELEGYPKSFQESWFDLGNPG